MYQGLCRKKSDIVVICICVGFILCAVNAMTERTREQRHQLTCSAQMMTLLDGWIQYTEDHDDELPINRLGGIFHDDEIPWVAPLESRSPLPLEDKIDSIIQGSLFSYINDVDSYHCPADTRLTNPSQRAFRSYSISNTMNGDNFGIRTPIATSMNQIINPSSSLVFIEEPDPRGTNHGAWLQGPFSQTPMWFDPVAIWHANACNLGLADGHVERRRWQNQITIDMGMMAQNAGTFVFGIIPHDGLEDYNYINKLYKCIDVND